MKTRCVLSGMIKPQYMRSSRGIHWRAEQWTRPYARGMGNPSKVSEAVSGEGSSQNRDSTLVDTISEVTPRDYTK